VAHSWEEMDELIARYGAQDADTDQDATQPPWETTLEEKDRTLLERFVSEAERGILVHEIRDRLDGGGKVGSALKAWSAKVGLITQPGTSAFEPRQQAKGRAHRLTDKGLRAARVLLNRSVVAPRRNE
jgi:hypothetical protein